MSANPFGNDTPFAPGDRVVRPADVYAWGRHEQTPVMHGTVLRRYATTVRDPDRMLYPEAEVYEIAWDDYWQDWPAGPPSFIGPHTNKGYFREGLVPADREDILVACMTVRA